MRLCLLAVLASDPPLALPPPVGGAELAAELGRPVPKTTAMVVTINRLRAMATPRLTRCRYRLDM
jgi:hypothetical protein